MIYYDSNKNKFINIDKRDIDITHITNSNISITNGFNCELTIRFDCSELNHFREWFDDSNHHERMRYPSEYKRDIFISDLTGKDMRFCNCYLSIFNLYDYTSQFEVLLKCDYYEIGGTYPELKAIYRDIKIDLILK
jgi:hypothetical protein